MALTLIIGNKNYSSWSFRPWIGMKAAGIAFDEVVISWFLAGPNTTTLSVKMFSAIQWEISPVIAAVSTILTAVSLVVCLINVALQKNTEQQS